MNVHFCFFGFVRNSTFNHKVNFNNFNVNFYLPSKKFEDKNEDIDIVEIKNKTTQNSNILTYNYDKNSFIKILKDNNIDYQKKGLPETHQHPYRTLSFFNNIRNVLEMVDSDDPEDIIILSRVDIEIIGLRMNIIRNILKKEDLIVQQVVKNKFCRDRFFIFKNKNKKYLTNLFDSTIGYFKELYSGEGYEHEYFNCPEILFLKHFRNSGLKLHQNDRVFEYKLSRYYSDEDKKKL